VQIHPHEIQGFANQQRRREILLLLDG